MSETTEPPAWNEARTLLGAAERMVASPDPTQWGGAIARIDNAIALLDRLASTSVQMGPRRMLAAAWSLRVRALERIGNPRALDEAILAQGKAIAHLRSLPQTPEQPQTRGELALALQHEGNLRQQRHADGDARAAIARYDEAIAVLRDLPAEGVAALRQLLGVTWLNRGSTWVRIDEPAAPAEALRSFEEAINALSKLPADAPPGQQTALAAAWMNRAHALLREAPDHDRAALARQAAEECLKIVAPLEREHISAADLGLKARHIICRAIGTALAGTASPTSGLRTELFAAVTDTIDDGLTVARHWHQRGATLPTAFVVDLFRFGAQTYLSQQPHFLAEFVLENVDPETSADALPWHPDLHGVAAEAIAIALRELERPQLLQIDAPGADRRIQSLHDLRAAAERLEVLRLAATPDAPGAGTAMS